MREGGRTPLRVTNLGAHTSLSLGWEEELGEVDQAAHQVLSARGAACL